MNGIDPNLWEIDHPYYAAEGNHYAVGHHNRYTSWRDFNASMLFAGDRDLNLLYRWDWHKLGHHGWCGADALYLYFILQRKAICCSAEIAITDADEAEVHAWLQECASFMGSIWEPVHDATVEAKR
ncbi:hypothetical protein ACFY97_18525 [Streptomyces klenkii]|uniref:hypothetical protein n=1 Tax=Streptomyces klenkii TaxID=1420899 RepID=UPI0036E312F9